MGIAELSGNLRAGPSQGGETFPSSSADVPLQLLSKQKAFNAATSVLVRQLNAASPAFVALDGLGPTETVTKGTLLYVRTQSPIVLRLTTSNPPGADVVAVVPVLGTVIMEFPDVRCLVLLEAQGTAMIEHFVCGPA